MVQGWGAADGGCMFEKKPVGCRLIWELQSKRNRQASGLEALGKLLGNPASCVVGGDGWT